LLEKDHDSCPEPPRKPTHMDPITILSAAAAVSAVAGKSWELVSWIRELCQGIKTVDERVQRLRSGVTELARACESVHAVLQPDSPSTTLTPPWDKDGSSAISISHQVSDCRRTVRELKGMLTDLRSGKSSRMSRHRKLQNRAEQIDGISARISIHTNALQISLQIATIKIALATPDFVIRELKEALRDIRKLLGGTESRNDGPLRLSGVKGDDEDQLVGLAQDALRRGTTLYEASVAGSTVGAESEIGSEKATFIDQWRNKTSDVAQSTHAPRDVQSHPAPDSDKLSPPVTHTPVEGAVPEASHSDEIASDAGSSAWDDDDSQFDPFSIPELKSAPTAEPPDLRRSLSDFSRPLDQWDRSDVVAHFGIKPDGRFEVMICAGTKVDPEDLMCLKESELSGNIDGRGERERDKLALHFAVLFQDVHLVEPLLKIGYSPNISAQVSDRSPLCALRTPIEIAIASHCEPVTKLLLKHGAELNPRGESSPCLQLLASTSLNLWPSTNVNAYTGVLRPLLASGFIRPVPWYRDPFPLDYTHPWTKSILHQICDLPRDWFHLRMPLIIFALKFYDRKRNLPVGSPLHFVIHMHDRKTLEFLLKTSDAQALDTHLHRKDMDRIVPLRYAIEEVRKRGVSLDMVRMLLEVGASLDDTSLAPSKYLGRFRMREIPIRETAMRSDRDDLKKLISRY
jgi:ankyrin repeat protein